jgi:hypothetical protein
MTTALVCLSFVLLVASPFLALMICKYAIERLRPWLTSDLQERRVEAGLCHACGYSLKGIKSLQCPECGAVRLRPSQPAKSS